MLTPTILKVQKGSEKEMKALYESCKEEVFALSCSLLNNNVKAAESVAVNVIKGSWAAVQSGIENIESEEDYLEYVKKKITATCKARAGQKGSESDDKAKAGSVKVPESMDQAVLRSIESYVNSVKRVKAEANKKRNIIFISVAACLVAFGIAIGIGIMGGSGGGGNKPQATLPPIQWATSVTATHYAEIVVEDYGTIKVALDEKTAPITVANFVSLAESGFYEGRKFHRIMEDFMMQGGAAEQGEKVTNIKGEFAANGVYNNLSHVRGAISMARANPYDSGSTQFFIVHEDSTFLNEKYAAFGYVVEGMEVVDAICEDSDPTDDNGTIPESEQPVIVSVTVYKA